MKILFVLAILFAVAHARLYATITYSGNNCSDPTQIIYVGVTNPGSCTEVDCFSAGQPTAIRCYDNINDVPIPTTNVVTTYTYAGENCTGEVIAAYQLVGLSGCLGVTTSTYYPSCSSSAVCSDSKCSSCDTTNYDLNTCNTFVKTFCGVDKSAFPAAPVSAPVSAPTGSAAPKSTPTGTSTPAKKSFASSLQVVSGASAAVLVAVALVV